MYDIYNINSDCQFFRINVYEIDMKHEILLKSEL